MINISDFVKRRPIVIYFVLAYAIAWSGILVVAGLKGFRATSFQLPDIMLMFAAMLVGPSLAGITLTAVVAGKKGLRSLGSRLGHWRVGMQWYAVVLLFPAFSLAVLMTLTVLLSPVFAPTFTGLGLMAGFLRRLVGRVLPCLSYR
jgi:uncharacterized protein